ncbi:uncharacterized protein ISCGN_008891 [Ixodes scapularis]
MPFNYRRRLFGGSTVSPRMWSDELREEPELRRLRGSWTVMTVEQQMFCALRFYDTGSFQGMVASDEHIARDQATVSIVVRAVSLAIVQFLGIRCGWIDFLQTTRERDDVERGFQRLGRIPGVIGCVDGTMIAVVGPSENDPTVTKAAYWCRKQYYALNVMVVCDADCSVMSIDPRNPGSVHDSFAWRYSWLRSNFEQGRLIDDGRFLLERSADECKRAWQAIRGRYGREARNCTGRSGAGRDDIRQPSWTLWNLLSFLKHQIHPRASKKPQMALEQANLVVAPEASGGLSPVTPTDPDECPEATDNEIPDTDTSDSLQDDLQLSPTCQLLLQLEQSNQVPTSSQLVPPQCAPSGAHPTLLSPPRPALVERQPQTPQPVPLRSRKRTHKGTSPQGRAQEDAALATVIEESVQLLLGVGLGGPTQQSSS